VDVSVNIVYISMEVDTGNCYSPSFLCQVFPHPLVTLSSASGPIEVVGEIIVSVIVLNEEYQLPIIICDGVQILSPLLGRPWLDIIIPQWRNMFPRETQPLQVPYRKRIRPW
jgi:hypothetical protein